MKIWQWGRVVFIEGKQGFGLKEGKNGCRRRREQNLAKTQQVAGLLFSASSRVSREVEDLPVATRDGLLAGFVETGGRRVSRRLPEYPSRHATGPKAGVLGFF